MSYDVGATYPACKHCGRQEERAPWEWNYTSNMVRAWCEAGADLAEFEGRPARECANVLADAITRMEAEPERFAAFDSPNGWGSMATLVPALRDLLVKLRGSPEGAIVWVSR